jgi:hypothetical protein
MEDELQKINANLDQIEHYLSIICRYFELKQKDEFPEG